MLPLKSLPVAWPLSVTLTNRTQIKQPSALSALYVHLEGRDGLLVLQSVFTTASPSLTETSKGHDKTNIDFLHSFSITRTV